MAHGTVRILSITHVLTTDGKTTKTSAVFVNGEHEGQTWNYVGEDVSPGQLVNVKYNPDDQFCYPAGTKITVPVRLKTLGFEHEMTGGNCTAYVRREGGKETMITLADEFGEAVQDVPTGFGDNVYVGTYDEGTSDSATEVYVGPLDVYLCRLVNGV
jgi:hypothetical protein